MKKRIFLIVLIILFILGIGKELFAQGSISNYSVVVYDYYKNKNYFYSGYVLYQVYDIEGYSFINASGEISRNNIELIFSSDYIDPNDDRFYNPYNQPLNDYDELYISDSFNITYTNNSGYKYMYLMEYVDIELDDERIGSEHINLSFSIKDFNIDYIKEPFIVNYEDQITSYGNLIDVYDMTRFDIKSINKYFIEVIDDEYTSSYLEPGSYKVLYRIYDTALNEKYLTLTIRVEYDESLSPIFIDNGIPDNIDITSNTPLETIKSYIKAYDKNDGNISDNIVFKTNYDEESLNIGSYYIECYVINSNGYGSYYKKDFLVSDLSAPSISKTSITQSYKAKLSIDDIIAIITPIDYSAYTYEVIYDGYSKSYSSIGEYYINIKLIDVYSNENTYKIIIKVIDDINPVVLIQEINTTTSSVLSDEEIISSMIISDKTKCMVSLNREEYDNNYNLVGSYMVYATVTDTSGNSTTNAISINVIADTYIKYYNNTIQIYNDHSLTEEELIVFLRSITDYTYDESSVSTIESNYFKSPYVVGIYDVNLITTDSSGHEYYENYKISVEEYLKTEQESNGIKEKIDSFFKSLIEAILKLLLFIFNFLF